MGKERYTMVCVHMSRSAPEIRRRRRSPPPMGTNEKGLVPSFLPEKGELGGDRKGGRRDGSGTSNTKRGRRTSEN